MTIGFGCGDRTKEHQIVARFGDPEAEELSIHGATQDELTAWIAMAHQVGTQPHDDVVHVNPQCSAGGCLGQPGLLGGNFF